MEKNDKNSYQSIHLFDLILFSSSKDDVLNLLREHLEGQTELLTVMTPNPEQVVMSRSNPTFLDHLQSAELLLPDGVGLVIASKCIGSSSKNSHLIERISGREVAEFLLLLTAQQRVPVLVIGGREYGQADSGVSTPQPLTAPYQHAVWIEGYADVQNPSTAEEAAVRAVIKKLKPAVVFVAFGAPVQERWLVEHKQVLAASGVKIAMVVGGAFDVLLGKIPQAPAWMQALGLEWLFRLWQEPWRWRRQLKLLKFIKLTYQSM